MADARPPPAAETPSASALMGSYPIDEDALRKWKRLHDDGVIDDYTFRCMKAAALGLTRKAVRRTRLSLLHLPADMLSKIASHAVVPRYSIFYVLRLDRRRICALRSTSGRNWCLRKS